MRRAVGVFRAARKGVAESFRLTPESYLKFLLMCKQDVVDELSEHMREVNKDSLG